MDDYRKYVQMAYIRVCRDSGWRFDYIRAAHFTADLLKISALEVWTQFSSLDIMEQVAKGEHPIVNNPEYDNRRTPLKKEN